MKKPERPVSAEVVRNTCLLHAKEDAKENKGVKGSVIGFLNKTMGEEHRYIICGWLFGGENWKPLHSADITPAQWHALELWIGASKTTDGQWLPHPAFRTEALAVLNAALGEYKNASSAVDVAVQLGGIITEITEMENEHAGDER